MSNVLRNLPSVNELLDSPPLKSLVNQVSRNVVVGRVSRFLDDLRGQVNQATGAKIPSSTELAERIAQWIAAEQHAPLRQVINATGVLLPAGLGRAPLALEAIQAIAEVASGYASVELDLATGQPAPRAAAVEKLLIKLTGAEAALVVNSSEAATLLTLAALARGREVLVARGQIQEVGDGCRLPDLFAASGSVLREVGAVGRTRAADFAAAMGAASAALMRIAPTRFATVGDSEEPALAELVALGRRQSLPVIEDLGSAALIDMSPFGLANQPLAGKSIQAGADVVLFGGDRLLGGPQCGIVLGRRSLLQKLSDHPLFRPLQATKLTLAALAATLRLYQDPALAERSIPLLSLLSTSLDNLRNRADRLAPQIAASGLAGVEVVEETVYLEGAAVPALAIKTVCLALAPSRGTASALAAQLRSGTPAVVARLQGNRLLLDLRSVLPRDDLHLVAACEGLASAPPAAPTTPASPTGEEPAP
ncbi:MAG: L-seryl-tRNA(Sec) selenium transferase [Pirellulaceae bacterium]